MIVTGQDLRAARVNAGLDLADVAEISGKSISHLSRIERGIREVTPSIVKGYEVATGRTFANVERREVLGLVAAAAVGVAPLAWLAESEEPPRHAGWAEVRGITEATEFLTTIDMTRGGAGSGGLAQHVLKWAFRFLHAQAKPDVRAALHSAAGAMADRVAWSCFDGGRYKVAHKLWLTALQVTADGDDPTLRAHIMLNFTYHEGEAGRFENAVSILRMALGDERICAAERANLHAMCGRQLAFLGDIEGALRQIALAEQAHADPDLSEVPVWAGFLSSPGHLDSVIGRAMLSAGRYELAAVRFSRAVEGFGPGRARGRAHSQIFLARAHAHLRLTDQSETEARAALSGLAGIRSGRIAKDLRQLRPLVGQDLQQEIDRALNSANN